ncbi:g13018 [Coccomyxa viridis]|uniref:G13018 protein n=1 Tax=Coccomyxa viridis TaxID=1274662 RepID=A0ABP1GG35_9CHLO
MITQRTLHTSHLRSIGGAKWPSIVSSGTASQHGIFCSLSTPFPLQRSQSLSSRRFKGPLARQALSVARQGPSAASRQSVAAASSQVAVFPAGRKQAKVTLPALIIVVSATEVLQRRDSIAEDLGAAISDGATGILLGDAQGLGGAELYEAAVLLKDLLRGRGILLNEDRTDIVGAAEADSGLPTVVARRSLPDAANLVGRRVASGQEAQQAASDGTSLLLLEGTSRPSAGTSEAI